MVKHDGRYAGDKRALILVNPEAGNGRARKMAVPLPSVARELGWEVETRETQGNGHEVELAAEAGREGWPVVVAVGGNTGCWPESETADGVSVAWG